MIKRPLWFSVLLLILKELVLSPGFKKISKLVLFPGFSHLEIWLFPRVEAVGNFLMGIVDSEGQ